MFWFRHMVSLGIVDASKAMFETANNVPLRNHIHLCSLFPYENVLPKNFIFSNDKENGAADWQNKQTSKTWKYAPYKYIVLL